MDSHKPQQKLTPVKHQPGTRFLATPSFGFSLALQECEIVQWAPSALFVHLKFPLVNKSEWVAVSSFQLVEVLDETNKARRTATKTPR